MTINRFVGENAFLSNFHHSTFSFNGKLWKTVEHCYQAHKTLDENQRELIRNAATPAEAKKLGQLVLMREDWDIIKLDLMKQLVHLKFENVFLQYQLLQTGDQELIEGNLWNDTFFGVCRGKGQNHLGKILMNERQLIKDSQNA
jgi:N-glycosidase YbiA